MAGMPLIFSFLCRHRKYFVNFVNTRRFICTGRVFCGYEYGFGSGYLGVYPCHSLLRTEIWSIWTSLMQKDGAQSGIEPMVTRGHHVMCPSHLTITPNGL